MFCAAFPARAIPSLPHNTSIFFKEETSMQTNGVRITWLGHATFKIVTPGGKVVLIDPWVTTNPKCPDELKTFEKVDLMLVSHGHFDHVADAVSIAKATNPQVAAIVELA